MKRPMTPGRFILYNTIIVAIALTICNISKALLA